MSTAIAAWRAAEDACFGYLAAACRSIPNVSAVVGAMPITLSYDAQGNLECWYFEINGGSKVPRIWKTEGTINRPYCCWFMDAKVEGFFASRARAQEIAGMLLTVLPANAADVPEIKCLDFTTMPVLSQATVDLTADQTVGGKVNGWRLTLPLEVLFGNTEYAPGTGG